MSFKPTKFPSISKTADENGCFKCILSTGEEIMIMPKYHTTKNKTEKEEAESKLYQRQYQRYLRHLKGNKTSAERPRRVIQVPQIEEEIALSDGSIVKIKPKSNSNPKNEIEYQQNKLYHRLYEREIKLYDDNLKLNLSKF